MRAGIFPRANEQPRADFVALLEMYLNCAWRAQIAIGLRKARTLTHTKRRWCKFVAKTTSALKRSRSRFCGVSIYII